jgi:hypothetical protein
MKAEEVEDATLLETEILVKPTYADKTSKAKT